MKAVDRVEADKKAEARRKRHQARAKSEAGWASNKIEFLILKIVNDQQSPLSCYKTRYRCSGPICLRKDDVCTPWTNNIHYLGLLVLTSANNVYLSYRIPII